MSSLNISITEDVYETLRRLKGQNQSFSDVIRSLAAEKDISRCYGILSAHKDELDIVEAEAIKARKERWKRVKL